jgi:hypothetical protein
MARHGGRHPPLRPRRGDRGAPGAGRRPRRGRGGIAFAAGYAHEPAVRAFVTGLAPAPLIFLARFLVLSPIAELLRPAPAVHAASAPPGRTPVVLVIFDELPAISLMGPGRRLDAARYPGFARLAASRPGIATPRPSRTAQRAQPRDPHGAAAPARRARWRPAAPIRAACSRCSADAGTSTSSSPSRMSVHRTSAVRAPTPARAAGWPRSHPT